MTLHDPKLASCIAYSIRMARRSGKYDSVVRLLDLALRTLVTSGKTCDNADKGCAGSILHRRVICLSDALVETKTSEDVSQTAFGSRCQPACDSLPASSSATTQTETEMITRQECEHLMQGLQTRVDEVQMSWEVMLARVNALEPGCGDHRNGGVRQAQHQENQKYRIQDLHQQRVHADSA